jgi:hypothetical protein
MGKIIKKHIKPDKDNLGSQVVINVKEDNIYIAINQSSGVSKICLTYNQLCSLSQAIHNAIDNHYQEYSNSIVKEKTARIYIDDPIDW